MELRPSGMVVVRLPDEPSGQFSLFIMTVCVSCLSDMYVWRSEDLQESVFSFHLDTGD